MKLNFPTDFNDHNYFSRCNFEMCSQSNHSKENIITFDFFATCILLYDVYDLTLYIIRISGNHSCLPVFVTFLVPYASLTFRHTYFLFLHLSASIQPYKVLLILSGPYCLPVFALVSFYLRLAAYPCFAMVFYRRKLQ